MANSKNKPFTLYLIIALFALPLITAYFLFFVADYGTSFHKSYGTLQRNLHIPELAKGKWLIVRLPSADDDPELTSAIAKRWLALGKDQHRVMVVALQNIDLHHSASEPSSSAHSSDLSLWPSLFLDPSYLMSIQNTSSCQYGSCQYLIFDPRGHAVTGYDGQFEAKHLDSDLRKLLKYTPDLKS